MLLLHEVSRGSTIVHLTQLVDFTSELQDALGTKLKNIRLVGGDHDIDYKNKAFGGTKLKTEFVKKANE